MEPAPGSQAAPESETRTDRSPLKTDEAAPPESLYAHPLLYETLRAPPQGAFDLFRHVVAKHADGPIESMMDPAAGPATWLLPFAAAGVRVAGNDLSPEMATRARQRLQRLGLSASNGVRRPDFEITEGDMRALSFHTGPFDVAFEASGTASYLRSSEDLKGLLTAMSDHLRPGGLLVLDLIFGPETLKPGTEDLIVWESAPRAIDGGGTARIQYVSEGRDPVRRLEHMRRTVFTAEVKGTPHLLEDRYSLRLWSTAEVLRAARALPHLELLSAHAVPSWDDAPIFEDLCTKSRELPADLDDEILVAFRRH